MSTLNDTPVTPELRGAVCDKLYETAARLLELLRLAEAVGYGPLDRAMNEPLEDVFNSLHNLTDFWPETVARQSAMDELKRELNITR